MSLWLSRAAEVVTVLAAAGFVAGVFCWQAARLGADYLRWRIGL